MSYDVSLVGAGPVERFMKGGTYALGGSTDAYLNITYNYSECYSLCGFSLRDLHGKKAIDTIEDLENAVEFLGTKKYAIDYWAPTPGNAGHALSVLLKWARQYPDGIWQVD